MWLIEILKAILIGIVEGITEWLPISSTGHMILLDEFISLEVTDEFKEMFLVVIQLGAIAAVPILFWNKLNPFSKAKSVEERKTTFSLWKKVIVGVIPAAVIGFLFDDFLEEKLYNSSAIKIAIIAAALIVYGVAFIVIELYNSKTNRNFRVNDVNDLTYKDAFVIGAFQVLSLIPGTSRSGSTILGGILTGVSRTAASEFSFFMAIPVMLGASLLKIAKFIIGGFEATGVEIAILLVGMAVAFLVSYAIIKILMDFVKRHSFTVFGVYRIVLGAAVIIYFTLVN